MTNDLATALGQVRNAVWQLLNDEHEGALVLGLEGLELEALLNQEDLEPDVVRPETGPAASLLAARDLLEGVPQLVSPAAWSSLQALLMKLG